MRALRLFFAHGFASALVVAACNDPGAAIDIVDARTERDAFRHVVVDVDLLAREGLGRNVGTYCIRVTFTGQTDYREDCRADLEDGDTKTVRFVSDGDLPEGAAIFVRLRLGPAEVGRGLAAPR